MLPVALQKIGYKKIASFRKKFGFLINERVSKLNSHNCTADICTYSRAEG